MPRRRARLRSRALAKPAPQFPRGRLALLPPRVQVLLRLGEPTFGIPSQVPWPDYVARFRLGPDDVPELLRLVTDLSLHVSGRRTARGFGRLHAWRALAQLAADGVAAAAAVAQPIVDLYLEDPEEEWLDNDAARVLALVGRPSLPLLLDVLDDPDAEWLWRDFALEALGEVGSTNPSTRDEVLDALLLALQREIEDAEALRPEDRDESLQRDSHATVIIDGCLDMDAGRGSRGPEVIEHVRRAFASGLVRDSCFGPWPVVRKALKTGEPLPT